jgi:hypothetical protein
MLLVPAAFFRDLLAGSLGDGATFVGSRSLVVPPALATEDAVGLLDRLVEAIGPLEAAPAASKSEEPPEWSPI